jgi:ABC-type lipoprotein release transport system permease subunit
VTELFTVPITNVMIGVLVLLALSLLVLAWIAWRQPLLARIGIRNITRRPAQTLLIVIGLMLSTLIMSAAFSTGDTVGFSITNTVFEGLQETDVILAFDPDRAEAGAPQQLRDQDVEALRRALDGNPHVDGVTAGLDVAAPVVNLERRLSEPEARLVGLEATTSTAFGGVRDLDGNRLSVGDLAPTEVYVTEALAESVDVAQGGTVTIYFDNEPHAFQVRQVVRNQSGGASAIDSGGAAAVMSLQGARELASRPGEVDTIGISAVGGVRDSADEADALVDDLEAILEGGTIPAQVAITKNEIVEIANLAGSIFTSIFVVFGLFSIGAGLLLIFLIFVMLAAERRTEMGISRAIGMQRTHLTQAFIAEGMTYNVGSAAIGAALGVGVAYILIAVLRSIVAEEAGFDVAFHVSPTGLVIAYGLGVTLTFATVAFSSWRAANLNIVRAIRDLPEPNAFQGRNRSLGGLALAVVGVGWTLVWFALASMLVVIGVLVFGISLASYGLPFIALGALLAWYVYGAQRVNRQPRPGEGKRRVAILVLWWITFNVIGLVTWLLLKSRPWAQRHRNGGGWAVWMLVGGAVLTYLGGWVWGQAFAYTAGHTLAILAVAMLAVYFGAASRPAFTIAGLLLVWFWLLPQPFSLLFEEGKGWSDPIRGIMQTLGLPEPKRITGNIEMFFVSGISIIASATLVVIFNAQWFLALIALAGRALGGLMPAVRTAIAYPLAARFRTGMTLAMFGLVVFSLVVMASLNYNFTQIFLGDAGRAGFDVIVETNENNPIDDLAAALAEQGYEVDGDVTGIARLVGNGSEATEAGSSEEDALLRVRGADDAFLDLAELPMQLRAEGYPTDASVIEALRTDPTTAVIAASYLKVPGGGAFGPGAEDRFELSVTEADLRDTSWQPIEVTVRDPETGAGRQLRIVGVIDQQASSVILDIDSLITNESNVIETFDGGAVRTFLVTTSEGESNAIEVARDMESALLERGVQASSVHQLIQDVAAQSTSFQLLFEGFMGLGLVVGIAALGVIAFRTVVERRQQIGMLRAIGYTRRLVAISFFLESSFIALVGIAMGFFLGLALSYNLMTSPDFTGGTEVDFQVPWVRLAVIGVIAYGASALMTLLPARAASRVPVAEALRYE